MHWLAGLFGSMTRSLRPGPSPLAAGAAARAVLAAGVIAGFGVSFGDVQAVAVACLGAACAVAFVGSGPYRVRAIGLAAQRLGAGLGIAVGAAACDVGGPSVERIAAIVGRLSALESVSA